MQSFGSYLLHMFTILASLGNIASNKRRSDTTIWPMRQLILRLQLAFGPIELNMFPDVNSSATNRWATTGPQIEGHQIVSIYGGLLIPFACKIQSGLQFVFCWARKYIRFAMSNWAHNIHPLQRDNARIQDDNIRSVCMVERY